MKTKTFFAPAFRQLKEVVYANNQDVVAVGYIEGLLNAMSQVAALLNEERQIVYANKNLLDFLHLLDFETILGARPGESIKCVNATLTEGGCGTSEKCRYCGAVNAILDSQKTQSKVIRECRIATNVDGQTESLDLKVTAAPVLIQSKAFTLFVLEDISDAKRRQILERLFFHDILNIAGSIKGFADILKITTQSDLLSQNEDLNECVEVVGKLSDELLEEIISQRTLLAAESGDVVLRPHPINSVDLMSETISYLGKNDYSQGKFIQVAADSEDISFWCDHTLLKRVIINMLKNALEASQPQQVITLRSFRKGEHVGFSVHNQSVMSEEVQMQVFQRSFSTKGFDRGIGTYSIRLLTERYLKGKVGFVSAPEIGTTFFAKVPL